ncbi:ammonium transporter [Flavicella marina]|uniref:ammonium transporter n=1 Tax=Flavicella marina TaxID=1475951 RepID=UPI00126548F2|nr:ammonium transporter [Flavicella marina]
MEALGASMDALWIIIAGILVFFMQAGFTLVETGFTRSKNAGNIIMKNLMDLIVGSIGFWAVGYAIMYGEGLNLGGYLGRFSPSEQGYFFFSADDFYNLFFQTVFAATAATIVSGAVAGRTKFTAYVIFSLIITTLIYPISGSWYWPFDDNAWLNTLGFIDFAGSSVVHAVGGWAALMGAIFVGPRIGKYKDGKSQAIPGHNILLGALGVMILWLGWFGFNGGSQLAFSSADDVTAVGSILINTNLAAACGALAALLYTWLRYGKPDISMTLNGALAGLVTITAGCANVSAGSAAIMGLIGGVAVVMAITFIDEKLKIDDPVGAISVHGVCGTLGTILVGVFAPDGDIITQTIGAFSYMAWAIVTSAIVFFILKKTIGLRVSEKEEIEGLDKHEHGIGVYND